MDTNKHTSTQNFYNKEIDNQIIRLKICQSIRRMIKRFKELDRATYQVREIQTPKIVEALDAIAAKFSAIQSDANAEVVQIIIYNQSIILAELGKGGGENLIIAFVQFDSIFSTKNCKVFKLKQEKRAFLKQALIDDKEEEICSQLNYEAQIVFISEQRQALKSAKSGAETKIKSIFDWLRRSFYVIN